MKQVAVNPATKNMLIWHDDQVAGVVKSARAVSHKGRELLAMPHGIFEYVILRNLGYDAPSPFRSYYQWGHVPPFDHQVTTAELVASYPRGYVLNGMGTGKTRSVLAAIDWLIQQGAISKVLVIAPLSILDSVWMTEVFRWVPHLICETLHGTRQKRLDLLAKPAHINVINYDGVSTILADLLKANYDMVILDESTAIKNARSKRWKNINKLATKANRVFAMTGSPTPQSPMDAHGQIQMITPNHKTRYFTAFRQNVMQQVGPYKWIARPNSSTTLHKFMQPAVQFKTEDCIQLPNLIETVRAVRATQEQIKAYKRMKTAMVTQINSGDVITAANAGVMLSKLLQIGAGFIYKNDGTGSRIDSAPRINELLSTLNSTQHKSVVFTNYRFSLDFVTQAIIQSGMTAEKISGETTPLERNRIFREFQQNPDPHVLVAHPAVAAHGITLTEADAVIWFDLPYSFERYTQANARIHRPGQVNQHYIVSLIGSKVEAAVLRRLQDRKSAQNILLELFKQ